MVRAYEKKNIKLHITCVRIPTGRRQASWLFTKRGEELELGTSRLQVDALTTRPRCLPAVKKLIGYSCMLLDKQDSCVIRLWSVTAKEYVKIFLT